MAQRRSRDSAAQLRKTKEGSRVQREKVERLEQLGSGSARATIKRPR